MPSARILLNGLIYLVAAACGGAALAAQGGRWNGHLDILTHFAPAYLAVGVVILAGAIFLPPGRRRLILSMLGGVAALSSMALLVPEYIRPATPLIAAGSPDELKVIQFNANALADPQPAIDWIGQQNPDVVVIVQGTPQLLRGVRARLSLKLICGVSCEVAILGRAKTTQPFNAPPGTPANLALYDYADTRGRFTVIGVHHTWPTAVGRHRRNSTDLAAVARRRPHDRLIVLGDFNSTPWSFARRREETALDLERRTRGMFTWPAAGSPIFAFLPLDHIYAGPGWRTVAVTRGPDIGSDHYPVVAILGPAR